MPTYKDETLENLHGVIADYSESFQERVAELWPVGSVARIKKGKGVVEVRIMAKPLYRGPGQFSLQVENIKTGCTYTVSPRVLEGGE